MRMYSRNGWVDVDDLDARETCARLPNEWTFARWTRPEGFPDINIPANWRELTGSRRVGLARQIDPKTPFDHDWQAGPVIEKYLAGTRHPDEGKS